MNLGNEAVILAFAIAYGISFGLTPLTGRMAKRFGLVDHPGSLPTSYKRHRDPIPYLGGIAIYVGVLGGSLLLFLVERTQVTPGTKLIAGLVLGLALALLGVVDDARPLPRSLRLLLQVAAAIAAWNIGFQVQASKWEALNLLITIFWIVGITNAFNLLDNMDGLLSGLAGVGAICFSAMGVIGEMPALAIVSGALAGAAFGFLGHNRHPATVFMGDAGSLFLGFMLALIGIELRFENLVRVTFLIPVVVLGLPILDTTLVLASRFLHKKPLFLGGRDHISHRLVQVGLPIKTSVYLLYWTAICLGWLGLVISRSTPQVGYMLLGLVIALGVFFGGLLLRVPVYEDAEPRLRSLKRPGKEDDARRLKES